MELNIPEQSILKELVQKTEKESMMQFLIFNTDIQTFKELWERYYRSTMYANEFKRRKNKNGRNVKKGSEYVFTHLGREMVSVDELKETAVNAIAELAKMGVELLITD